MSYKSILCISDLHIPYHHPQAFDFLKALKKKIKPDLIVNGGDELDKHALSFHDSDPDLPSAGDELKQSKKYLSGLKGSKRSSRASLIKSMSALYKSGARIPASMFKARRK